MYATTAGIALAAGLSFDAFSLPRDATGWTALAVSPRTPKAVADKIYRDIETALARKPDIILTLPVDPVAGATAFRPAVDGGAK